MKKYLACAITGLVLGSILFILNGCTTTQRCEVQSNVSIAATAAIGATLGCENPDALKPYIDEAIAKLKLCADPKRAPVPQGVGALVCEPAIDIVLSAGLKALPPEAKCGSGASLDLIKGTAIAACEAILP